jgi:hypothetical protein
MVDFGPRPGGVAALDRRTPQVLATFWQAAGLLPKTEDEPFAEQFGIALQAYVAAEGSVR